MTNFAFAGESWNSEDGLNRLMRSQFKNDFYQLANFYQAQINPLYCSIASSVMILNALNYGKIPSQKISEIKKPEGGIIEFHLFTQQGFLNQETDKIKKAEIIRFQEKNATGNHDAGLAIGDLAKILTQAYKLKVQLNYAAENDQESLNKFRQTAKKTLADQTSFLITNFDGKILGQKTNGHIAPVAAYDEASDSLLILDPALHKNQWFWADLTKVYSAMNTKDGENYRGYLVVSK